MGSSQSKRNEEEKKKEAKRKEDEENRRIYEEELRRQRELERQQEFWRQQELKRQQELERREELKRKQEFRRRQELKRQQELERREELEKQQELKRQQELERRQELEKQQKLKREAELLQYFSNLHIQGRTQIEQGFVEKVEEKPQFIQTLLQYVGKKSWTNKMNSVDAGAFILEPLDNTSAEFTEQESRFMKSIRNSFQITDIERVINPCLFLQFKLKEKQYRKENLGAVVIKKFYHGTKQQYADGICENNFDWRLHGTGTGHRFGQGVSFSPFASYATHYGDKMSIDKVMFAVDVLVGRCLEGNGNTVIPDWGADTTVNAKKSVYVKYDDNEFYPAYLIHYQGFEIRHG